MEDAVIHHWETTLGTRVYRVGIFHGNYLLETGSGEWVAKRSRHPSHLRWWIWVDRELRYRGFDRMPAFVTDGREWVLTSRVESRPATYRNPEEIRKAAGLLSLFHTAGRGLLTPRASSGSQTLMERIEIRYRSFSQLMKSVNRVDGELGEMLREYGALYQRYGKVARERLKHLPLRKLIGWERGGRCVAHRDLASHNILIDESGKSWLIDFETAEYDAQIGDLWQLLSRSLSEQDWDPTVLRETVAAYEKNRPLVPAERMILSVLLGFPNEFFREVLGLTLEKKGYTKEKTLPYLQKIARALPQWQEFLRDWAGW
ncbi:spore coat protein [Kroppenstedtia guangzhouensis]|uniref:Spore coat protein n=1 Tax=Kroppenstedtia guangzhouensis TaxID=1274356 RepID=A0ABQ1GBH5_9BACL|nr:phosphotransferase [Kroppenstedtia guangzhouensis]GGA40469.1 spore coat protein [Kroppenstedtia guangzhouensis]